MRRRLRRQLSRRKLGAVVLLGLLASCQSNPKAQEIENAAIAAKIEAEVDRRIAASPTMTHGKQTTYAGGDPWPTRIAMVFAGLCGAAVFGAITYRVATFKRAKDCSTR